MQTFWIVWLGQVVSTLGTKVTEFSLGVWAYQTTGSVTQFALILVFSYLPNFLISPFAGALVDRWNRRWAMILSDSVTGLTGLSLMVLVATGNLEIWHIYISVSVSSLAKAFQWPAYLASIPQLVPRQNLSRVNGMVQISRGLASILGPIIAGFLIEIIQIQGVLLIDAGTYLVALLTLFSVRFPAVSHDKPQRQLVKLSQLWQETVLGWNYVIQRPGLHRLILFFSVTYLTEGMVQVLFWPLVLSFGSESQLGIVLSISGCGMLLGSVIVSTWGGFKRRIYGVLFLVGWQGLCLCLGGFQPSLTIAAIGGFGYLFALPIIVSCNHTIWQCKVPLELQGRVFALQNQIEKAILILTQLSIGPLVERVFEPLLMPDGLLADSVGQLIGIGEGRGSAFLLILVGITNVCAAAIGYNTPRLRRVEKEIPDAIVS
ncbi:MAG: MFS transporter [Microcoleaceae cyanobacterium]